MVQPFERLPDTARIWIFASRNPLNEKETVEAMNDYIEGWRAHGQPLTGGSTVLHRHFLVVAVDESAGSASGCSIDDFRRALREIEKKTGQQFLEASFVPFEIEGKIRFYPYNELSGAEWNGETITFNPAVAVKGDLLHRWRIKSAESWLQRLLKSKKENVTS